MNTLIRRIHDSATTRYWHFVHAHFPYLWAKRLYRQELGKTLDFSDGHSLDLNEKILWLSFFTDTRPWSRLADKWAVHDFVRQRVGADVLVPLLGRWDRAADIDFTALPDSFVIKPNNGSYDVILVPDKQRADLADIRRRLDRSLHTRFGLDNAEPHYLRIKPCILAEEMLPTDGPEGLVDYKVWCFDGRPFGVLACVGRDPVTHHAHLVCYDLHWRRHPEWLAPAFRNDCTLPRPQGLERMLDVAARLSTGFPEVRVDLYYVRDRLYFGEMTFTSNYGMMPYFTQETLDEMGRSCPLPRRTLTDRWQSLLTRYWPK